MTICRDTNQSSAPCCASAAYLYTLALDGPSLAWEFLRRHPEYGSEWLNALRPQRDAVAARWGLRCRP